MALAAALPFRRIGPIDPPGPLVLAVPHAGRIYPSALQRQSAVPLSALQQLEDRYVDRLIAPALHTGAVAIVARLARAWIDLNRAPADVDWPPHSPHQHSARARSGLGLVPTRLYGQPLWTRRWAAHEIASRLASVHEPYHQAIAEALAAALRVHGRAVLLDVHSMPPLKGPLAPQCVIGNLHGRSSTAGAVEAAANAARSAGWRVAINKPYAGAYTLERHGAARSGVDAIQIEVDRALYLQPDLLTPAPGLGPVAQRLAAIAWAVSAAPSPRAAIAAE